MQNGLSGFSLSQFVQNLEKQKQTFDLKEKFELIEVLEDHSQIAETKSELLRLVGEDCAVIH